MQIIDDISETPEYSFMLDEDGNVVELNAVVADNPDEDDHSDDVIRIYRSGTVQIY